MQRRAPPPSIPHPSRPSPPTRYNKRTSERPTPASSTAASEASASPAASRAQASSGSSSRRLPWANVFRSLRWGFAFVLGSHIFIDYFYEFSPCYGISMMPVFNSYGDYALISKYYRRGRGVQVGDVISFAHPVDANGRAIKRIVGMAGDFVERDTPGEGIERNKRGPMMIQVPQGHCYVAGDNLTWSRDSRHYGPLPLGLIKGKVVARVGTWIWGAEVLSNKMREAEKEDDEEVG